MPTFSPPLKIYLAFNMDILKIIIVCIVAAFLCIVLRSHKPEYSLLTATITVVIILSIIFKNLIEPFNLLSQKIESYGVDIAYFKVALKALGIGWVASFSADICRDAGQTSLASIAETVGRCGIFLLSLPLILKVVDLALGFIT